jgi:hypothetical protein
MGCVEGSGVPVLNKGRKVLKVATQGQVSADFDFAESVFVWWRSHGNRHLIKY